MTQHAEFSTQIAQLIAQDTELSAHNTQCSAQNTELSARNAELRTYLKCYAHPAGPSVPRFLVSLRWCHLAS